MTRLAVIGTGKLGEALLSGLLRAGRAPADLMVTARRPDRAAELTERYGVRAVSNVEAAAESNIMLLTVKPQDIESLLAELAPVATHDKLIISVVAGIPTALFERRLGEHTPVVRVMTNTPVLVDQAMSAISAGANATEEHLVATEAIFEPVGKVLRVPESQQDAVTALSGSGPAYFFFLVEAMIDAGILLGLPRTVAADLMVQTVLGSAVMLRDTGEHPVRLREAVTSPGGTTINAIRELENHGVRAAFLAAIEAARDRARDLGHALD
ncbi:MAG: pyrroline-5-carboxylate reductase [Mycobacteriales bacterium]